MVSVDKEPRSWQRGTDTQHQNLGFLNTPPPFLVVEGQQVCGSVHHPLGNSSMMPKSWELSAARTEKSRLQGSHQQVGRAGLAPHS